MVLINRNALQGIFWTLLEPMIINLDSWNEQYANSRVMCIIGPWNVPWKVNSNEKLHKFWHQYFTFKSCMGLYVWGDNSLVTNSWWVFWKSGNPFKLPVSHRQTRSAKVRKVTLCLWLQSNKMRTSDGRMWQYMTRRVIAHIPVSIKDIFTYFLLRNIHFHCISTSIMSHYEECVWSMD